LSEHNHVVDKSGDIDPGKVADAISRIEPDERERILQDFGEFKGYLSARIRMAENFGMSEERMAIVAQICPATRSRATAKSSCCRSCGRPVRKKRGIAWRTCSSDWRRKSVRIDGRRANRPAGRRPGFFRGRQGRL